MGETPVYQEFLENILKSLTNHPEDVKVEKKVDEMGVLLVIKVNQEDLGVVIGRRGNTIQAIRTLVKIIGLKNRARVNIKLEQPSR
ncbi:KH domain-containing protein [bacterium]|nr:KH domain-containing protein [bacterium]